MITQDIQTCRRIVQSAIEKILDRLIHLIIHTNSKIKIRGKRKTIKKALGSTGTNPIMPSVTFFIL